MTIACDQRRPFHLGSVSAAATRRIQPTRDSQQCNNHPHHVTDVIYAAIINAANLPHVSGVSPTAALPLNRLPSHARLAYVAPTRSLDSSWPTITFPMHPVHVASE